MSRAQRLNSDAVEIMQRRMLVLVFVLKWRFELSDERIILAVHSSLNGEFMSSFRDLFLKSILLLISMTSIWQFHLIGLDCPRYARKGPNFQNDKRQCTHRMDFIIDFVLDVRCIPTSFDYLKLKPLVVESAFMNFKVNT